MRDFNKPSALQIQERKRGRGTSEPELPVYSEIGPGAERVSGFIMGLPNLPKPRKHRRWRRTNQAVHEVEMADGEARGPFAVWRRK